MDFGCSVSLLRLQLCFLSAACLRVEEALVGVAEALAALALVAGDELAWAPALLVEDGAALVAEGTAGVVLALALVFLRKLTTTYIQFFNAVPKPIYLPSSLTYPCTCLVGYSERPFEACNIAAPRRDAMKYHINIRLLYISVVNYIINKNTLVAMVCSFPEITDGKRRGVQTTSSLAWPPPRLLVLPRPSP